MLWTDSRSARLVFLVSAFFGTARLYETQPAGLLPTSPKE
jgi:hypothetical protein